MTSPNLCLFCITIMLPMVKLMHLQALLMCLLHIARNVILWLTSSIFYNLDDKYVNSPKNAKKLGKTIPTENQLMNDSSKMG